MKKTSIRQDIYLFLKSPDYTQFDDVTVKEKIKILWKVLILTHIGLILVNMPVMILQKLEIISKIPMKTDILLNSIQVHNVNYKPYFILSIIFIVPLLEEISFRLAQTKFRLNYFIISVSILLASYINYFLNYFLGNILWMPKSYFLFSIIPILYILLISALIGSVFYRFKAKLMGLEEFWNNNTGIIIYTIAALFAVAHIMNLKFENSDLIFMPIILLPFLVYGLSFGYLRARLGIIYSIVLHFIFLALRFGLPELSLMLKSYAHH